MKTDFKFDVKSIELFVKKLASPHASQDLNAFMDALPGNVGQNMMIMAAVAWSLAAFSGLYAYMQLQELTQVRADLQAAEALKPIVPVLTDVAANPAEVKKFVDEIKEVYQGLNITASSAGVYIEAKSTAQFAQFREAIGHVQNGGQGWRVTVDKLCVGRECARSPLAASLKINKVDIKKP